MESLSLLEKLQILFQNVFAHPIFILILLIPAFLIFFNKKVTKKLLVLIYIVVLLVVLFVGNDVIFKLFDNVVNGLFMTLYFPNFITLFIVEMLSAIIMLITFLKDITKLSKRINIVAFSLIQGIFCLVLTVIKANKIDIYKENALYSNNDVLTLMQLLMGVFLLQILSLLVIYTVEKITMKLDGKDSPKEKIKANSIPVKVKPDKKVKLEKQKPLDKTLILDKHIVALDLNQKIQEEAERIKPAVPLDKSLILDKNISSDNLKHKINQETEELIKKQRPLDKTLILDKNINAEDLSYQLQKQNEEISKMNRPATALNQNLIESNKISSENLIKKIEDEEKAQLEKLTPLAPLDKKLIINKNMTSSELKKEPQKPAKDYSKITSFADFKPEFPDAKTKTVEVKTPDLEELSIKLISENPKVEKKNVEMPKELIGNITIVNFDKTVALIKDLKRVYTF